jgi:hypothetical protein
LPPDYLFPEFGKDVPVAIAVHSRDTETIFPVAVGSSLMSSTEMIACGMKGKGVNILHSYQDTLWFVILKSLYVIDLCMILGNLEQKQSHQKLS